MRLSVFADEHEQGCRNRAQMRCCPYLPTGRGKVGKSIFLSNGSFKMLTVYKWQRSPCPSCPTGINTTFLQYDNLLLPYQFRGFSKMLSLLKSNISMEMLLYIVSVKSFIPIPLFFFQLLQRTCCYYKSVVLSEHKLYSTESEKDLPTFLSYSVFRSKKGTTFAICTNWGFGRYDF